MIFTAVTLGSRRAAGRDDEAAGTMARRPDGRWAMAAVTLHPRVSFAGAAPDTAALHALHESAHAECFIANSVACAVHCEPRA